MLTYEDKLNRDLQWALREGGMHFDNDSKVHQTLRRVCQRLDDLGIEYAVVGGMALFFHGFRRFTEDVDILVSRSAVKLIHEHLEGRGYVAPFEGSKNLRDADTGVRIEFIIAGDYPGDGKPKPVVFPEPRQVSVTLDGIRCLNLATLVELKLASGTAHWRRRDLADVQDLMRALNLGREFAEQLNPSVREAYRQLWLELQEENGNSP